MSKKTKLTDKEKEIIKKVTDYIQYVPDEQKIYILGVVDTVGMLCRAEKAGQEADVFLRKIYTELVLIRKELQALRLEPKVESNQGVQVFETKYIGEDDSKVVVSFTLSGCTWLKLSKSFAWRKVRSYISQQE